MKIIAGLVLVFCLAQVNAGCFCGLPAGKDVCHSSPETSVPLVVRPKTLPKVEFKPVPERIIVKPPSVKPIPVIKAFGDLCSGKRTIVTPAFVPRPGCSSCKFSNNNNNNYNGNGGRLTFFDRLDEQNSQNHQSSGSGYTNGISFSSLNGDSVNTFGSYGGSSYGGSYGGSYNGYNGGSYNGYNGGSTYGTAGSCGGSSNGGGVTYGTVSTSSTGSSSSSSSSSNNNLYSGSSGSYGYADSAPYESPAIPADPVSLSLAYKLQSNQAAGTHEDKLNFGFRTMPKEVKVETKKGKNAIPEENLFRLNGEIVELKKVPVSAPKSLDDEAAEDLVEEDAISQEVIVDEAPVKKLTYSDIGFRPATIKSGKFNKVVGNAPIQSDVIVDDNVAATCNDGFVAGKVIVQNTAPVQEVFYASKPTIPCDSTGERQVNFWSSSSSNSHNSHASSSCSKSHYFSTLDE